MLRHDKRYEHCFSSMYFGMSSSKQRTQQPQDLQVVQKQTNIYCAHHATHPITLSFQLFFRSYPSSRRHSHFIPPCIHHTKDCTLTRTTIGCCHMPNRANKLTVKGLRSKLYKGHGRMACFTFGIIYEKATM